MKNREQGTGTREQKAGEQGYMLLGLIVAVALILLALSVAASQVAFSLRREREAESARRANQYVRAIQLYYRKFQRYPASIQQLENTNNVRFLRRQYVDPLTGKADYRLIGVGQNKTTVKGFFGEPLQGIAGPGLGAAAGMASTSFGGQSTTPGGVTGPGSSTGLGTTTGPGSATGSTDSSNSSGFGSSTGFGSTSGFGGSSGLGSAAGMQSAGGFSGSAGPFMGVGSSATGNSILTPNEQTTYQTWEFLYDPRVEQLKAAAALNNGGGMMGSGTLGQSPGSMGQPSGVFNPSPPPPNGPNQSSPQ
jgi:type II secretory pathway pseudopilin PulG